LNFHLSVVIGNVLTLLGDGLQQFVDRLEFDHFPHNRLFPEQFAQGAAHDAVSVRFKRIEAKRLFMSEYFTYFLAISF
jgi:hypothetical protein